MPLFGLSDSSFLSIFWFVAHNFVFDKYMKKSGSRLQLSKVTGIYLLFLENEANGLNFSPFFRKGKRI